MQTKPANIPINSKYLHGVGASAYFYIQETSDKNIFTIKRFNEKGELDCDNLFQPQTEGFNINSEFKFTFVSHCLKCTIIQNNKKYIFIKLQQ